MSEREFPPSIRRLQKARREGKILKSRMLGVAFTWWVLIFFIFPASSWVRNGSLVQWSNYRSWTPEVAFLSAYMLGVKTIVLLVGVVALSGVCTGLIQSKGAFLPNQILQGFEQYRPSAIFGKFKQGGVEVILGGLRVGLIVLILMPLFLEIFSIVPGVFVGREGLAREEFYRIIKGVFFRGGGALTIIAFIAYWLARWRFFRQLKMSLQEVRDEYREDEGDPHTKAARKNEHRALLLSEIERRVKSSKVVVVRSAVLNGR